MSLRFTKEQRLQGKRNILKLASWLSKNKVHGWEMMSSENCAMAQCRKAFPDNPDAPQEWDYDLAYPFFAFHEREEHAFSRRGGDLLFANYLSQEEQVALLRKFARTNPGYKVT